jgi:hypothetical protein
MGAILFDAARGYFLGSNQKSIDLMVNMGFGKMQGELLWVPITKVMMSGNGFGTIELVARAERLSVADFLAIGLS